VYQSVDQCCSTQFKGGCQPGATGNPATCYTPDSFWPDRTCKSSIKCDILFPRTNVFLTGEECCSKSFADGCRVLPTTCKVPQYVRKTCVDGQPAECKRGGWLSRTWRKGGVAGLQRALPAAGGGCGASAAAQLRLCPALPAGAARSHAPLPPRTTGWSIYQAQGDCCQKEFGLSSC
jgi:hypothetical protein